MQAHTHTHRDTNAPRAQTRTHAPTHPHAHAPTNPNTRHPTPKHPHTQTPRHPDTHTPRHPDSRPEEAMSQAIPDWRGACFRDSHKFHEISCQVIPMIFNKNPRNFESSNSPKIPRIFREYLQFVWKYSRIPCQDFRKAKKEQRPTEELAARPRRTLTRTQLSKCFYIYI